MSTAPLLVELFTEELPPKALRTLGEAFANGLATSLQQSGLAPAGAQVTAIASPRRLAVHLDGVLSQAADKAVTQRLMPVAIGLDANGNATTALLKKLASIGASESAVSMLRRERDGKAEILVYESTSKGLSLVLGLQKALYSSLDVLPIPKVMTYQLPNGHDDVSFVRPVRGLVALHGSQVVEGVSMFGHTAGRVTHGHRFQGVKDIMLNDADEYESRLEREGGVVASFDKRKAEIHRLLLQRAEECGDTLGELADYAALLDEVTALVEMPTVYVGKFDAEFLSVPAECLILTMKLNQKYFPLFLSEGGLSSRFLIVSNMRLDNPSNVIEGNERVVRPRLADARFFFETDKKTRLADRIPKLASVVYHNKLGSQGERVERVRKLAVEIAGKIGADAALADRAALLAKADLVTDMVGEFPELQGTMGRYYALHDGESPMVADAIAQHYQPRFAGDALPSSPVGIAVALADKLETLAGLFSIGQVPTGDKDPFALRRHALGVLRMLIERDLALTLPGLIEHAMAPFSGNTREAREQLAAYVYERLGGYLRDLGYTTLEVEAAIAAHPPWGEFPARLAAIRAFTKLPEAESLAAANKRIGNILKKSPERYGRADPSRFVEDAERTLHAALAAAQPVFEAHLAKRDYTSALKSLAPMKAPVDAFFDGVMVNVEDPALRVNRLALLADLHDLMNRVADLSKLAA